MKLTFRLKLAALIVMASASSLLASTVGTTFQFEWNTDDAGFSQTFLTITAALNVETPSAAAIKDFEITTPNGVWTPTGFTPTGGSSTGAPTIVGTPDLTVTGTLANPVLTFDPDNATEFQAGAFKVTLTTDSIDGSDPVTQTDTGGTSIGNWVNVPLGTTIPDATGTWTLLLVAAGTLAAGYRVQGARTKA